MLAGGSFAAPSTCLRCQLRRIIRQKRHTNRPSWRSRTNGSQSCAFSAGTRYHQEAEDDGIFLQDQKRDTTKHDVLRRTHPLGRVVGQPGRRQRQSSATLKSSNMNHPFEVVVMQDVVEPKLQESAREAALSTESSGISSDDILSEITGQEVTQDEINKSIDSLRPSNTIVEQSGYDSLISRLLDGYTTPQLSEYFSKVLGLQSIEANEIYLTSKQSLRENGFISTPAWRPGRTPLEQRHGTTTILKKSEIGMSRTKLAHQILRFAWSLVVSTKEQEIGELEVRLTFAQMSFLFDLLIDGEPMHRTMIDSELLRRNSDVQVYRPQRFMRITARRHIAEQVAEQLENKLTGLAFLKVPLAPFKSLLGKDGHPNQFDQLFDDASLTYISQRTQTSLIWTKDKTMITIYGLSDESRYQARRFLLSFLDFPSPSSMAVSSLFIPNESNDQPRSSTTTVLLPHIGSPSLHFRDRRHDLSRLVAPNMKIMSALGTAYKSLGPSDLDSRQAKNGSATLDVEDLATQLTNIKPLFPVPKDAVVKREGQQAYTFHDPGQSYWQFAYPNDSPWRVQLCSFLQPSTDGDNHISSSRFSHLADDDLPSKGSIENAQRTIIQPQLPGIGTLLSYFEPDTLYDAARAPEMRVPRLVAHFMPSPLNEIGVKVVQNLPRVELHYDLLADATESGPGKVMDVRFRQMQARLSTQQLRVPLPSENADLRFSRARMLKAQPELILQDAEVARFTATLQDSVRNGSGVLGSEPTLKIKLPSWVKGKLKARFGTAHEAEYLFERFEQVQHTDFMPVIQSRSMADVIDPEMKQLLDSMPESVSLRLTEIEGGIIGGKRNELFLRHLPTVRRPNQKKIDSPQPAFEADGQSQRTQLDGKDIQRQMNTDLVNTSLRIANALSRINAGELKPLKLPAKVPNDAFSGEAIHTSADSGY